MEEDGDKKLMSRRRSTILQSLHLEVKDERAATYKKVAAILQKAEDDRNDEENQILQSCVDIVKEVKLRQKKRDRVKARIEEVEDPPEVLEEKCMRLAAAISRATSLAVYTGAGISTAASIPDYRGTNGVWTRLQQGKDIGNHDLSQAEPTLTHMALYSLYKARVLKHVVSQNCDGLHLRSGIPRTLLSEVHGNMNVEVCRSCKPSREYWRLFDVTEKTARYSHGTGRNCHKCNSPLQDSIVHFGERGNLLWPINWSGASRAAKQADVILCLGSSLKVLKKYPWLWQMDRPVAKRSQLYIVNLQWTPKDDIATLKINGRCDDVMRKVMAHLGIEIPEYNRLKDPIFYHAIPLTASEQSTTTQPCIEVPPNIPETGLIQVECPENEETEQNMAAYPAPFFTALPFLSMGLPFPPMYIYPQLTPYLYLPFIQMATEPVEAQKPKPACDFCMEHEGSVNCLYYQKTVGDNEVVEVKEEEEVTEIKQEEVKPEEGTEEIIKEEGSKEEIKDSESLNLDNVPLPSAKNPGWFGKGYRKGMKRKR